MLSFLLFYALDSPVSVFLASDADDYGYAIAVDSNGYVYVAGITTHPVTFSTDRYVIGDTGRSDVFVSKLSPDLSTHIATVIIGSPCPDYARDIEVSPSGDVYVVGWTTCIDSFAPDRVIMGDSGNPGVFVTRLSGDLREHLGTAILSSSSWDYSYSFTIGPDGDVFIVGYTYDYSTFAPERNVFGNTGSYDVFVSRLSSDLSTHIATAIIGSSGTDFGQSIGIDSTGNVLITGATWSPNDFAPDRLVFGNTGMGDVFVSRISPDLNTHISTAIVASSGNDGAASLIIGDSGDVYVAGYTDGAGDFSTDREVFGIPGGTDAFVSRLLVDLSSHLGTAIIASGEDDGAYSLFVDSSLLMVAGYTEDAQGFSTSRIVVGNAGLQDAFLSILSRDLSHHNSTLVMASDSDDVSFDLERFSRGIFMGGTTENSSSFAGGGTLFGTGGMRDVFVSRVELPFVYEGESISPYVRISGGNIWIEVPRSGRMHVALFSIDGRLIKRWNAEISVPGTYSFPLKIPPGIYVIRMKFDEGVSSYIVPIPEGW